MAQNIIPFSSNLLALAWAAEVVDAQQQALNPVCQATKAVHNQFSHANRRRRTLDGVDVSSVTTGGSEGSDIELVGHGLRRRRTLEGGESSDNVHKRFQRPSREPDLDYEPTGAAAIGASSAQHTLLPASALAGRRASKSALQVQVPAVGDETASFGGGIALTPPCSPGTPCVSGSSALPAALLAAAASAAAAANNSTGVHPSPRMATSALPSFPVPTITAPSPSLTNQPMLSPKPLLSPKQAGGPIMRTLVSLAAASANTNNGSSGNLGPITPSWATPSAPTLQLHIQQQQHVKQEFPTSPHFPQPAAQCGQPPQPAYIDPSALAAFLLAARTPAGPVSLPPPPLPPRPPAPTPAALMGGRPLPIPVTGGILRGGGSVMQDLARRAAASQANALANSAGTSHNSSNGQANMLSCPLPPPLHKQLSSASANSSGSSISEEGPRNGTSSHTNNTPASPRSPASNSMDTAILNAAEVVRRCSLASGRPLDAATAAAALAQALNNTVVPGHVLGQPLTGGQVAQAVGWGAAGTPGFQPMMAFTEHASRRFTS